jgi:N-acetylneuraminic acid mutarotase
MKKFIITMIVLLLNLMSFNELFADGWTQKANFGGSERYATVGFSIGSKGYIGTGSDGSTYYKDFWEYDSVTDTWTQKADFGGAARGLAVGFSIGSKGYIGTGSDGSTYYKDFWEYDPANDTWTQKAPFGGTARASSVGFPIESKGYLGTGSDGSTEYKDFWEYDPNSDTWAKKADCGGTARVLAVGFFIGTKGYIGMGATSKDIWEYDPANDTWTQKVDFGGAARVWAVSFSIGSNGFIGTGFDGTIGYKDFWKYDLSIDMIPDQFTFIDQTNVEMDEDIISNTITVSGIQAPVAVSVTGGTYSINGGTYTSETGTVNNGDTVTVKMKSSKFTHTMTDATLVMGTISDTFSVTTQNIPDVGESDPCFSATAAFGSPLARQVEILRQFRDGYLLTNDFGRKFVAWYYRHGPVAAKFIKDKPVIKTAVRILLYPLIGFSILLMSGYLPLAMLGLILIVVILKRKPQQTSGYYS